MGCRAAVHIRNVSCTRHFITYIAPWLFVGAKSIWSLLGNKSLTKDRKRKREREKHTHKEERKKSRERVKV